MNTLTEKNLEILKEKYSRLMLVDNNPDFNIISIDFLAIIKKLNILNDYDFETANQYGVNVSNVFDANDIEENILRIKNFLEENKNNKNINEKKIIFAKEIIFLFEEEEEAEENHL
jgi:hypothetical protein